MGSRERAIDIGAARAREILARLPAEARSARLDAGLSQIEVARALRMSRSQYSRIERGLSPDLSITIAVRMFAVLGFDLAVRPYPAGDAINDAAQVALLGRLRARCHPSLTWRTEVPLPLPGDLRAWDATITSDAIRAAVEAETRLRDLQALDRRLALKQRDGGFDHVILLVLGSRANRSIIRAHADTLRTRFPVAGVTALERLETGSDLGGNALIVL
jgi:transcriptional regulator with XRE-family HTH domain